jgi:hypothetical protein
MEVAENAVSACNFLSTRGDFRLLYLYVMGRKACYTLSTLIPPHANSPTCWAHQSLYMPPTPKGTRYYRNPVDIESSIKTMSPPALGFIGLGVMGYPMALNLLNRLETGTRLHVYDVSSQVLDNFKQEAPNLISICSSAREVAEKSVKSTDSVVMKTRD